MPRLLSSLFLLGLVMLIFMGQMSFVAGEYYEEEQPEAVFAADEQYANETFVEVEPESIDALNRGYEVRNHLYKRHISFDILAQRYREDVASDRMAPDRDGVYQPNRTATEAHLENATEIGIEGVEEQFAPSHIAARAVASETPVGAALELYSTYQVGIRILQISQELNAANEEAEQELNRTLASMDDSPPPPSSTALRESYGGALDGVIYYNYVNEHGSPDEAETAEQRLLEYRQGVELVTKHRETPWGHITYEVVRWGDPRATIDAPYFSVIRVVRFSEFRLEDRYYAYVYPHVNYVDFGDSLRNHVHHEGQADGAREFLEGGGHCVDTLNEARDNCEKGLSFQPRDVRDSEVTIPEHRRINRIALSQAEHEQLVAMKEYAEAELDTVETMDDRLTQQQRHYLWKPFDSSISGHWHAPPFEDEFSTEERRIAYLKSLLQAVASYNTEAYYQNGSEGYYVDTASRTEAVHRITTKFDSAEEFESHIETELETTDSQLQTMENWGGDSDGSAHQAQLFGTRYVHYLETALFGEGHDRPTEEPNTVTEMLAAPTPTNAILLLLADAIVAGIGLLIIGPIVLTLSRSRL